jgi:hypothetical protein
MENQTKNPGVEGPHDDVIDIEVFAKQGKKPPVGKKYKVRVGHQHHIFEQHIVTGKDILVKTGIAPLECYWLYQKLKDCDFEKIDLTEKVDLTRQGVEHFVVKPTEVFHYSVDGEPETTDEKELTPNQILEAAGLTPFKDNPDTPLKMVCPAVKFVSAFRGETNVS